MASASIRPPRAGLKLLGNALDWVERGLVPDVAIRAGIRRLCRQRLAEAPEDPARRADEIEAFVAEMDAAPIALVPEKANEQHYEVPAEFFELCLGPHRKYSSCWWPAEIDELGGAEEASLAATCERAELGAGQEILELGCGWGSFSLYAAARYRGSRVTAVSNSHSQRRFLEAEARARGLDNVRFLTADINAFEPPPPLRGPGGYDRVVSVEMFEHLRNWRALLERVAGWLAPGGKLFVHVFCHRDRPYLFETEGADNWLGRHFFTGGMMPSDELLPRFQDHLRLEQRWRWSGEHYQRTAEAWLRRLDENRERARAILGATYGSDRAELWFRRWRVFFLACAELFGFREGREWWVAHYRFARR